MQRTTNNDVNVASAGVEAFAEWRRPAGPFVFALGGGAAADVVHQHVQRSDGAHASPGFATEFDSTALVGGPLATARLRLHLGVAAWIELALRGEVLFSDLEGNPTALWGAFAGVGTGLAF